jgi:N-acylneuraminate cytidylyltransferase
MAEIPGLSRPISVLALVPARGGSKSVPRKNLRTVAGRPLIGWSIEQAKRAQHVDRVVVTTDDAEIAEVARAWGAEVPFLRPAELAGDLSTDIEYHQHALSWLATAEGYRPDLVVNLRPTMPVRRVATIDRAVATLAARPDVDSLRSVLLAEQTPYKMWRIGEEGLLETVVTLPGVAEPYNQPRQILPIVYWQDGYIDVAWARVILEQKSTTGRRILPFVIEEPSMDIDYEDEIPATERLLAAMDEPSAIVPVKHERHSS